MNKLFIKKIKIEELDINYQFNEDIIFIYGVSQTAKSTIANAIMTAFGFEIEYETDTEQKYYNFHSTLEINFNNRFFSIENKSNSEKLNKHTKIFHELSNINISSNSKYKSTNITISDLMIYFYITQQKNSIDRFISNKLIKGSEDIKLYLIDPENYNFNNIAKEYYEKKKNLDTAKKIRKINDIINKESNISPDELLNLENISKDIENIRIQLFNLYNQKRKILNKISNNKEYLTLMKDLEKELKSISFNKNGTSFNLFEILSETNFFGNWSKPNLSINEENVLINELDKIKQRIKDLQIKEKKLNDEFLSYPNEVKIALNKTTIKEILCDSQKVSILEDEFSEIKDKFKKFEEKTKNQIQDFDLKIKEKVKQIGFQPSKQGSGDLIVKIMKCLHYQKYNNFPIIYDGGFDDFDLESKKLVFNYIKENKNGQVFFFCTLDEENSDFIKFIKNKYNENILFIELEKNY